jgi:hypothetical protein
MKNDKFQENLSRPDTGPRPGGWETLFYTDLRTETFVLYLINWLVFITVMESVYSAVRTDSLYKADYALSSKG